MKTLLKQALDVLDGAEQMNPSRPDRFEIELDAGQIDELSSAIRAEIAKPEQSFVIWLHAADIKMPWDRTLPYKLDFEKDESWACAVPLLARMKT